MLDAFDSNGKPIPYQLSQEDAEKALKEGTIKLDDSKWYNVFDPSGKPLQVQGSNIPDAIKAGWRLETESEKRIDTLTKEQLANTSGLEEGLKSFGNEALFGVPGMIKDHYSSPEELEAQKAVEDKYSTERTVGGILGFGANALATGGLVGAAGKGVEGAILGTRAAEAANAVAKTAEVADGLSVVRDAAEAASLGAPTFGKKVLASAAKYATEGAIYGAPAAVTEAALGDPEAGVEHLIATAGMSAILGAGIEALSPVAKGVLKTIGKPVHNLNPEENALQSLMYSRDVASNKAINALGDRKEIGQFVINNGFMKGLTEGSPDYISRTDQLESKFGQVVGDIRNKADDVVADGITTKELANKLEADIIDELRAYPGNSSKIKQVQEYISELEQSRSFRNYNEAAAKLEEAGIKDPAVYFTDSGGKKIPNEKSLQRAMSVAGVSEDVQNDIMKTVTNDKWKPGELWDIQKKLEKPIKDIRTPGDQAEVLMRIRKANDEIVVDKLKSVDEEMGTSFSKDLKLANKNFRYATTLKTIIDKSYERELSNRNLSLTDYILGHTGGGILGGALGFFGSDDEHKGKNALGGGLIGTALGMVGNKFLRENGNRLIALYGNKLGTFVSHVAQENGEKEIGKIPGILSQLASGVKLPPANTISIKSVEDFNRWVAILKSAQDNPNIQKNIQELVANTQDGTPERAKLVSQKVQQQLSMAQQAAIPKEKPPQPFSNNQPAKPTKQEMKTLETHVNHLLNPYQLDLDNPNPYYPKIHEQKVAQITAYGMKPEAYKLPTSVRAKLESFTGSSFGVDGVQIQQSYQTQQQPAQQKTRQPTRKETLPAAKYTPLQKIEQG